MTMAMPFNPLRQVKGHEEPMVPTSNLWVGNLGGETVDSDLVELFGPYGQLDNVATYSARSFAFVFFKAVENAKAAKEGLQGATVHGNQIKIEFARPGKPCKSLWVGGIGPAISKEEVEKEFSKFGKIEDFRFLKDRNTAFIDYYCVEDASQALRNTNGKQIGGNRIRVDFLRSHISKREQWPVSQDSKDGFISRPDSNFPAKRLHSQSGDWRADDQPSNILCISYPPSLQIDEQMLHNAMILFGEIEKIKSFPVRQCSFVVFRSVEEGRRAKEGLEGRLFNDPRITIMYSSNELAKDYPGPSPHAKGPRPDMYLNEPQSRTSQMDILGQLHSGIPGMLSGKIPSGVLGQPMRPFVPQGSLEPLLPGPEYGDLASLGHNWRRASPIPPAQGGRPSMVPTSGSWDIYDVSQMPRDAKRPRIEASMPADDSGFSLRKTDDLGPGLERSYCLGSANDAIIQGKEQLTSVADRRSAIIDDDCIWRGIIAKGGTPVCHARCVLFGERMEVELPRVVNCSARTGLDVLAKHRAEAIGFNVVYFLPDSEDDFASYTEFLRYLGSKNRAGVAKLDDGTTMFLVPPSEFLRKDLKVVGPERLYGVVLKLAPPSPNPAAVQQYQPLPSHTDYIVQLPQVKEQTLQIDQSRMMPEEPKPPQRPLEQSISANQLPTLTPELIASLTSLLPAASQPSSLSGSQPSSLSSTTHYPLTQIIPYGRMESQGWNHDQLASDPAMFSFHQPGNQINSSAQLPFLQKYAAVSGVTTHSDQMAHSGLQFQESIVGLPQHAVQTSRPVSNFTMPVQSAQSEHNVLGKCVNQLDAPHNTVNGYGITHGADASASYSLSALQQTGDQHHVSNLLHGISFSQPLNTMQAFTDKANMETPAQVQQVQSMPSEAASGKSDVEVDKIQRYQSTIEYATSLLRQAQQKQQKQQLPNAGVQGTWNQP